MKTRRPQLTPGMDPNYYCRWQADRRALNKSMGLTWDGRPRVRKIRFDLAKLSRTARHVVTNRDRRHRLMSESAATVLLAKLDVLAASLNRNFDRLPGPVQADVLQLAHEISAVRLEFWPNVLQTKEDLK